MSEIKLMLGDCLERMKEIPDRSIDMVLCDLPYGLTQNRWDSVIPFDPLWNEYKRITKSNAVIALFASQPFSSAIVMSNPKMFKHEWIWIKNRGGNFANTVREPMKEHEHVLIFSNGKWTYNKQMQERTGGGAERVKYRFNKSTESKNYGKFDRASQSSGKLRVPSSWQKFNVEVGLHPTQKPVALLEYLIKTYTNEGETVLDNCMGSGSACVACLNTGRDFIGIELDENYFEIARNRIESCLNDIGGQNGLQKTNADKIRSMTDEELADFIQRVEIGDFNCNDYGKTFCDMCDGQYECDDCLKSWLKQPAEGE